MDKARSRRNLRNLSAEELAAALILAAQHAYVGLMIGLTVALHELPTTSAFREAYPFMWCGAIAGTAVSIFAFLGYGWTGPPDRTGWEEWDFFF